MATQPQRPALPPQPAHAAPTPTPTPSPPVGDQQALKTELSKTDRKPAPTPAGTIADEQRERSDEIAKMGVEAYKRSIDQRAPEDQPKPVPGVGPLQVEERRPTVEAHGR